MVMAQRTWSGAWRCWITGITTNTTTSRPLFSTYSSAKTTLRPAPACLPPASSWARSRGLKRIFGPKGFTALDGMGLLVKGFEHRPALGIPYNPAYYAELIEAAGFTPAGDTLSGYMHRSIQFPEKVHQVSQAVQEKRGLRIARYSRRSDLRSLVPKIARPVQLPASKARPATPP